MERRVEISVNINILYKIQERIRLYFILVSKCTKNQVILLRHLSGPFFLVSCQLPTQSFVRVRALTTFAKNIQAGLLLLSFSFQQIFNPRWAWSKPVKKGERGNKTGRRVCMHNGQKRLTPPLLKLLGQLLSIEQLPNQCCSMSHKCQNDNGSSNYGLLVITPVAQNQDKNCAWQLKVEDSTLSVWRSLHADMLFTLVLIAARYEDCVWRLIWKGRI